MSKEMEEFKEHVKKCFTEKLEGLNDGYIEARKDGQDKLAYAWQTTFINILSLYWPSITEEYGHFINTTEMKIVKDMTEECRKAHPEIWIENKMWIEDQHKATGE